MISRKKTPSRNSTNIVPTPSIQQIPPIDANENVLTICTIQVQTLKTWVSTLNASLTEAGLVFGKDGLRCTKLDKTGKVLIHTELYNEHLEFYECNIGNISVGVDMKVFTNLINGIENNTTLTIFIKKTNYDEGVTKFLSFRSDKGEGQFKLQEMRVIDCDNLETEYPAINYRSIITMPSIQFQKIIKDAIASKYSSLEISIIGGARREDGTCSNEIIFKSFNKDSCCEIHMTEYDILQTTEPEEIIKASFCCRTLLNFTKCSSLSQSMELRLDNDGKPLVVKYLISNLGSINLCLLPLDST
jgi:proliferating cell nuclear antigen PCNA